MSDAPIQKLDLDVLVEIFLTCLSIENESNFDWVEKDPRLVLTHICSSWRKIVISTPKLWSIIHITLPSFDVFSTTRSSPPYYLGCLDSEILDKFNVCRNIVLTWLERSGGCPLSISIFQHYDSLIVPTEVNITQYLLSFLTDTVIANRHRIVDLNIAYWACDDVLLEALRMSSLLSEGMPMLQNIRMKSTIGTNTRPSYSINWDNIHMKLIRWTDIVGLLSNSPQITTVTTDRSLEFQPSDFVSFPQHTWKGMTKLHIFPNMWPEYPAKLLEKLLTDVLPHCHSLKELKVEARDSSILPNPSGVPTQAYEIGEVAVYHLETLTLLLERSHEVERFVKRLYLPLIKKFEFEYFQVHNTFANFEEILKAAICDSKHDVSLVLRFPWKLHGVTSKNMVQLLRPLKNLGSLDIQKGTPWEGIYPGTYPAPPQPKSWIYTDVFDDTLLSSLMPFGEECSDTMCPSLKVLHIDEDFVTGFTSRGIHRFVEARKRAHLEHPERIADFISGDSLLALQHYKYLLPQQLSQLLPGFLRF